MWNSLSLYVLRVRDTLTLTQLSVLALTANKILSDDNAGVILAPYGFTQVGLGTVLVKKSFLILGNPLI